MTDEKTWTALLERVRGEFLEMPGLRVTELQARRLWRLEPDVCRAVLRALVAERFLIVRDGAYLRNGR